MGTLYIDRRGAKLDFDRGAMVIREPDEAPRSIPLRLIDRLVVVGNTQVSTGLLTRLAENGSGVTILSGRGNARNSILHGFGHGDIARRIGQFRLCSDPEALIHWARRLVWLRLAGQRRVLSVALRGRPELRRPLSVALRDIQFAMFQVRREGSRLEQLRGREGAATAAFFRGYRELFPRSVAFTGRNRRPPRDSVNAALSLGYTLVHSEAVRAICGAGLEPMMGFLHEPTYGRESLACDLAELGRCSVERLVWRLFAEQRLTTESFFSSREAVFLNKSARATFFRAYENAAHVHRRWLARAARRLARECAAQAGLDTTAETP